MFWRRKPANGLDVSDFTVTEADCPDCGESYRRVTGYVHVRGGGTVASYSANCRSHPHHDVALDLILGSWGEDSPVDDHETFSCWIEPRPGSATLDDSPLTMRTRAVEHENAWLMGRLVTREEALVDPRLPDIWSIVDALVLGVPDIRRIRSGRTR